MEENLQEKLSKTKIIIIGSGWYGCYIGLRLQELGINNYIIVEKNSEIFSESSMYNQNRLHQGFHYPRDYTTRKSSKKGFDNFIKKFSDLTKIVYKNYYAVHKNSLLDFKTYLNIFDYEKYDFEIIKNELSENYEGIINVKERYISPWASKRYFESKNLNINYNCSAKYVNEKLFIENHEIDLKTKYVFDCTYGSLVANNNFYEEFYLMFVYKKLSNINYDALTIMDGMFYSIYPYDYKNELYTISGVKEGIIPNKNISEKNISEKRKELETKLNCDIRNFSNYFEYNNYFVARKYKLKTGSDFRGTLIHKNSCNFYSILSGKIDTIFELDNMIESIEL